MSSNHHHHSESGGEHYGRSFLAFVLFLTISLLSLLCCVRFSFITPRSMVNIFVNEEYVTALRNDVLEYSHDLCRDCMLPEDALDSTVTYETVYGIENAYISGALGASREFTKTTYEDNVAELKKNIETAVNAAVKDNNISVDKNQKNGAAQVSEFVSTYLIKRIQIAHLDMLETVINIGKLASTIGIVVLAVLAVILVLIIISIGNKRYRALRSVIHSVNAAAILNLILILGVQIVKHFKTLVLYPTYVADAFMRYVNRCEGVVGFSSLVLFTVAFMLMIVVWKLNRETKK